MIEAYHRPKTLEDALALVQRPVKTLPMGGGSLLNAPHDEAFEVVDLQALGLGKSVQQGKFMHIGATMRLQELADADGLPVSIRQVIEKETTRNLRNQRTVIGALISADGRSPLACAMLALDAQFDLLPENQAFDYGQLLHQRAWVAEGLPHLPGRLVTGMKVNSEVAFAYEYVARSPADRPVVSVAAAAWSSGRLRVVVGGWGQVPRLALDAPETGGVDEAVRSAAAEAGDEWASAAYRQDAAVTLASRAVEKILA